MSFLTDILCTGADLLRLKIQVEAKYLAAKFEDGTRSLQSFVKQLCFLWGMLVLHYSSIEG
jgi:hypothetical protein